MGRAIVREPQAFLMDEPLSNLDAKLRVQMRAEVSRIQRRLAVATLYVTHDQIEAMTMGDRVAVMRSGHLQQCDTPQTLYDEPVNLFVAAFIGSPAMNLYQAVVEEDGANIRLGAQRLELPHHLRGDAAIGPYRGKSVVVGVRPEHLADAALSEHARTNGGWANGEQTNERARLQGEVDLVEALGAEKLVHFKIDASRLQASDERLSTDEDVELTAGELAEQGAAAGVARVPPESRLRAGERATFEVTTSRLHLFDADTGETLGSRVVADRA
jgi:multiple sugar transport system ATP-binding protein